MNKKITWGLIIIFISLFYLFQKYIPEGILMYVFNYQVIIILIGIYLILQKKNSLGLAISFIGLYLYLQRFFSEYFEKYISKEAKVSILLKDNSGFDLKTHTIKPHRIDLDLMYNDDFMEVQTRVKHTITNENKGIVLLHGIAGSGKTNYIKWLTSQIPNKKFIFIPTTMISSLTDPSFIGVLVDNQNSVLVLEDCENYIAERTTLNSNTDVVSSILNIADGMLSDVLECQLICTFNSDISKIDSALLRKGRLIAEYKFRELTVEKSNAYLKSIGKDITVDEPRSLAELTNMDEKSLKDTTKENKKIGF